MSAETERIRELFVRDMPPAGRFLAGHVKPADFGRSLDNAAGDFVTLVKALAGMNERILSVTTRSLSIQLFNNSKRLEEVLAVFGPLVTRAAETAAVPAERELLQAFAFLKRSFPEVWFAGRLKLTFAAAGALEEMTNASGAMIALPFTEVKKITAVEAIPMQAGFKAGPAVLTVENKETFYALAAGGFPADCLLYTNGYPNTAAAALIQLLARGGFTFYHSGDLDPDGILILEKVRELAGRPVTPYMMSAAVFDRYRAWARPLAGTMLRQLSRVGEETRSRAELAALIGRITETGMGVEQEIIDYTDSYTV